MKEETKETLIAFNKTKEWGVDDHNIIETITDYGDEVWQGAGDRHRWYTMIPTVVSVCGIALMYDRYDVHGEEANVDDCIGGYTLDMFVEVKPVEITTMTYEPI